ncbi:biotin carboxyl carrier protein of acetyl-CoA carboxylase, chloroplastic-like [Cynara cardunculus var. scolymus]|uniref:Biotin carboxyl carrier protein of acetyl-CoA carboxylase n=1 Tax=Cynara cardunculus var. scolymus TaxID=59895 RepID=A0A103XYL5_CYNCS|nr:biotin carboxyl carrier protein of acetyl-CoA carboxylase, chloroplastic-like [Cynara cardunculus var. scolymus]KVH99268.1 hypothetical protein Ccrd_022500 [Cynara cardunculus var. scolymus]
MASFAIPSPKTSALLAAQPSHKQNFSPKHRNNSVVLFHSDLKSKCALVAGSSSLGFQASKKNQNDGMRVSAQLDEAALQKSDSTPSSEKSVVDSTRETSSEITIPDAASITAFMNQVAGLVQLVDSRDIVELQLKQQDCEVLIRKKEALPTPPAAPMVMTQSPQPLAMLQSQPPPPQATPPSSGPAPSASAPASPTPAKPKSSHPPLKCPMAGTFYRSPAPGVAPFVKVGDKVKKGQVVCIIEAMKLMNEIEADQSGTVVDILAEDGKPVSLDTPLFVIEP